MALMCTCNRPDCIACKTGPDFHVDNTQKKVFDCRLDTCIGQCDCEKIEQCKYSPEYYLRTNPVHGGKVTCHKCNGFILDEEYVGYLDRQHKDELPKVHFHTDCYNHYEHYYGLDKPID